MHRLFLVLLMVFIGSACAQEELWTLRLPDTAGLPSYVKTTWMAQMGERHGGSHLGLQEYTVNIPIADGRRSHVGKCWINVQGNATVTLLDVGGELDLRRDEMYVFSLPVTLIYPLQKRGDRRLMFTVIPRYAGDADCAAHAWDLSLVLDYMVHLNEQLTYSIGLAASPRFAEYVVVPYITFAWQATPDWLLRLRGYRFAALYACSDRLRIGPSISSEGGSWMVSTPEGRQIFRVRSLTASVTAEYVLSPTGDKSKGILSASIGSTLATVAEFCRRNSKRDSISQRHYHPGLILSLELDFRF